MSTKTTIPVETIDDAIYESDAGLTVYQRYSGRGMYGDECFGLVGDQRALLRFFIQLASTVEYTQLELAIELADHMRQDSLGRYDTIFYFPGFELEGESVRGADD